MAEHGLQIIERIKKIYESGENIIKYIKQGSDRANTVEDILISYDFQSGSYVDFVNKNEEYVETFTNAIAKIFDGLDYNTVMEVGVGEATTLGNLIPKLKHGTNFFGFDISWSRIYVGKDYLKTKNVKAKLFLGDLFNIPMKDSSVDVIYTSHSIEPNGGREKEAIIELYRVTKNYLILLEPTNNFATQEGIDRMKSNGYVQNLISVINELNLNIIEYKPFEISSNELNPTGLYVIKKEAQNSNDVDFCCPISKENLIEYDDHFFSPASLISYPKIKNIPCLFSSYGILTSKHDLL